MTNRRSLENHSKVALTRLRRTAGVPELLLGCASGPSSVAAASLAVVRQALTGHGAARGFAIQEQ